MHIQLNLFNLLTQALLRQEVDPVTGHFVPGFSFDHFLPTQKDLAQFPLLYIYSSLSSTGC